MTKLLCRSVALIGASMVLAGSSFGSVTYSLVDLGDIPGGTNGSYATGINSLGAVSGSSYIGGGSSTLTSAFRWTSGGGMQALGTIVPSSVSSFGYGINDSGVVVGESPNASRPNSAFISQPGSAMTGVPGLSPTLTLSTAQAINNSGQVTGIANDGTRHAYRYTPGTGIVYRAAPSGLVGSGETIGYAINESGAMAGFSPINGGARATFWAADGTAVNLGRLAGGTLDYSFAYGMNDANAVVGQAGGRIGTTDHLRPFLWTSGSGMIDLGDLGDSTRDGVALDINNNSWVVGQYNMLAGPVNQVGFLWMPGAGMVNLNSIVDSSGAGWIITSTGGINDSGQIAATAYNLDGGYSHAVLLTLVPAPGGCVLAGFGLAVAARRRRARS